ncbi:hypothetical protein [Aeromicrobium sp. CTD01-1L150]|uniref:hypothetical protein n=1 Tax=Aeromicrobium sp. CTD01-1L150 TaxID=3341830 RepID=UPI0035BFE3D0
MLDLAAQGPASLPALDLAAHGPASLPVLDLAAHGPASLFLPAHGVGGATDLPVPFFYAVVGATWALTISFAVLALAWKTPKLQGPEPDVQEPPRRPWLAIVGLVLGAWFIGSLFLGPDDTSNGGIGALYVLVWVGLVPLALVAGHVWKDLSPWRSLQWLIGRVSGRPNGFVVLPERWGYWPAVAGIFAFVWLELVSPSAGDVMTVRTWVAGYLVWVVVGAVVAGPRWLDRADPFDAYSALVAHLSPFVRNRRPELHNSLRSLVHVPVAPGLVTLVAVLLGSTAFDSFAASQTWQSRTPSVVVDTLVLLTFCAVAALAFQAAARATGGVSRQERAALPGLMAHSLVPIVVGYIFAHYLSYLLERGQGVVIALLQPFGIAEDASITYFLSERPDLLSTLKVGFVVLGHVLAVVSAHDKALAVLPRSHRLTGQLAMLLLMVGYTFTGIYLLLSV